MKLRNLPVLLTLAALAFLPASEAFAQVHAGADPITRSLTADDSDVALLVKFTGSQPFSSVTVTAGDVLLKYGTASADTADVTITRCGATDGTLDVDNAECDTLGELVDSINVSANWVAVIVDGVRSDVTAGATLLAFAAKNASLTQGATLTWDTSANFEATQCLNCPRTMRGYLSNPNSLTSGLAPNPFAGKQAAFIIGQFTSTYASGTSAIQIISSKVEHSETLGAASEVVTIGPAPAGGATTVLKELDYFPFGVLAGKDERLLVRINNSAAASAVAIYAYGESWSHRSN